MTIPVAPALRACEVVPDVVQTFRSARHGRPEGLHYDDFPLYLQSCGRAAPALRPEPALHDPERRLETCHGRNVEAPRRREAVAGREERVRLVDIGRQLCAGLAAAHAQGVLHRDLKPANVLIDNRGFVRITDFGIAILRADADIHMLTGTPAYMAPEPRTPDTVLSERTDVYALGLVLYELPVGQPAFDRSGTSHPPRPSTLVPNVDPQLERVVMQALSPDPRERPASALEMAANLPDIAGRHDAGLTTAAASAPPARLRTRWCIGLTALAVVAMVIVGFSFYVSPGARTLNERDTIVLADFENTTGEPVFDGAQEGCACGPIGAVASGTMLYPMAQLGLARAAALANDLTTARTAYDRMLTLWNEADPNLQPLRDTRLELSRLRQRDLPRNTKRASR